MKKNIKILLSILLVLIWFIIIYCFSNMPSKESNGKSKEVIKQVIERTVNPNQNVVYSQENTILNNKGQQINNKTETMVDKLNKPLRKCMHASVYFVLGILIFNFFRIYNLKNWKNALFTIIIAFLYACTDEYHQTFVNGRTGQFTDTLIDTLGAICGVICICIIMKIIKRLKDNKKSKSLEDIN